MKQLLTAKEAIDYLGYDSPDQFRRAVNNGLLPPPFDTTCKAVRWSKPEIDDYLIRKAPTREDRAKDVLNKRLGIAS